MTAGIGIFTGAKWAFAAVVIASLGGILVEFQDIAEDGFGIGQAGFLIIFAFSMIAAFSGRKQDARIAE